MPTAAAARNANPPIITVVLRKKGVCSSGGGGSEGSVSAVVGPVAMRLLVVLGVAELGIADCGDGVVAGGSGALD